MEQLGLTVNDKLIKKTVPLWWSNIRMKETGGMKLTAAGFNSLVDAGLKVYTIKFENDTVLTSQHIIWLDHFIDCPFYIKGTKIHVFGERMAVQLMLFAGDYIKFSTAKANSLKSA